MIDCRNSEPDGSHVANTDCALTALTQHRPFFILCHPHGIDSFVLTGFSGDSSGNPYEVDYDSIGFRGDQLAAGESLTDGGHVLIVTCPKPVTLKVTSDQVLACRAFH